MAKSYIKIETQAMKAMERDFERLSTPEPFAHGKQRLDAALEAGYEGTQAAVPVGDGDYRRPAGALKESGRFTSEMTNDVWTGSVAYGYEGPDPVVNYAAWVRFKNLRKTGEDFLGDPMAAVTAMFDAAVNAPFDDVFGVTHGG